MSAVRADFDDSVKAKLAQCFGASDAVSTLAEICPELILVYMLDVDPSLGLEYRNVFDGGLLFKQHPVLHTAMKEACGSDRFGDFRKEFLKITQPNPLESISTYSSLIRGAFSQKYYGRAVDALYEYLEHNNRNFRSSHRHYYARFCSIVQSSGTGKTRTMIELGNKGVIVLYMNLRAKQDSWPLRDELPARILSEDLESLTAEKYSERCCAFFTAIFRQLKIWLSAYVKLHENNYRAAVKDWQRAMDGSGIPDDVRRARGKFFKDVYDEHTKILDKRADREHWYSGYFEDALRESYRSLLDGLPQLFDKYSDDPTLVIAIDEAQCLSHVVNNTWRPSDIVCQTINTYSCVRTRTESVWVTFISSSSRIADYSAPSIIPNNLRIPVGGTMLFTPYTLLGWDQGAPPFSDDPLTDTSNSTFERLVGFGRPLWHSHLNVGYEGLLELGKEKLLNAVSFKTNDVHHVLAVIGQRFGLRLRFGHRDSAAYLEAGVSNHLLVCHSITEDRKWKYTSYPSEPFLSHVSGFLLHKQERNVVDALTCIKKKVDNGMIEIDEKGQFVSRIVWLLCKDLLLRRMHEPNSTEVLYCQEVPIPQFLEMCFGESVWPEDETQKEAAKEAFKDAYVNFSHWVSMEAQICEKDRKPWCPKIWLLRLWLRTIAVQCCDDQPLIDKVMPICFKTFGGKSFDNARDQMSLIAASDKADERADPCSVKSIARNHHSIRCVMDLPWIAVTFDMGVKESVVCSTFSTSRLDNVNANVTEYTSDEEETSEDGILEDEFEEDAPDEALCLRIYASGMSAQTFLFLAELPGLEHILNDIVRRAMGPPHPLPIQQRLADVMQFGETSEEDHMAWEYGKQAL